VRPTSKTTALQVRGNHFYYLNDDGTVMLTYTAGGGFVLDPDGSHGGKMNPIAAGGDAPTIPFGFTAIQVTWYMIPQVPLGVYSLRNMVNKYANIFFDPNIIPAGSTPEVGTLFYIGPEGPAKPYYTVSDKVVYDVTLNFLYRRGARAPGEVARGHNAVFCPATREFRRIATGPLNGTQTGFNTNAASATPPGDPDLANLPSDAGVLVSGTNPGHNIYDYGDLANIWKFI
jgi:hypothetical protein